MHKNYTKFNLLSLFAIIASIFLLTMFFEDSKTVVSFADPGLEEAVREAIAKDEGTIYLEDVNTLQELDASDRKIEVLDGIEDLMELRDLNLEDNFVKSVTPIKNLTKLQTLNLRNNEITDLEVINFQDIIHLAIRDLSLRHNVKRDQDGNGTRLSDISLLSQMVSLRKLSLRDNHIEDLTPLSNLRRLTELDIRENKFDTIEPLETLTRLKELNLRDNNVKTLDPIRYLSRLTYLNIHSNSNLKSLEPIEELVNLETLIMRNIKIHDNSFLQNLTRLQRFNAIDTGIEELDSEIIEELLKKGALQGRVDPVRMLYTLDAPTIDKDSGFYTEKLNLDIETTTENGRIYYTLDGSEPTLNSSVYTEPIIIDTIGDNEATIVRAKVLTEDHTMSETITKTYFVDQSIQNRFNLPVFSLVTDPDHLFDDEIGIYADGNYNNRGSEWERPVHIEYIEDTGDVLLSQNGGIRIHGGATRVYDQKSLRLYGDSRYDEQNNLNYPFFSNLKKQNQDQIIDTFDNLILRNSGNDWSQTMFNDALMQSLVEPLGTIDVQAYQPIVTFINGEYRGLYNLRERQDEYYFENHYDISSDDLVILQNNAELYRGNNKEVYHYHKMIDYIKEQGVKEQKHLKHVETMMDFESFIDYFASEIYFGNLDWPHNNIRFWRKTIDEYDEDAPYGHDGRWRWAMNDTDFGFYYREDDIIFGYNEQPINYKTNSIEWVMGKKDGRRGQYTWPNFLFRELMQNEEFKNQFLTRFNDLINSYLSKTVSDSKVEELKSGIQEEMPYQIERWGAIDSMDTWEEYIDRKYVFAQERPTYIRQYVMEEFDIDDLVVLAINNETDQGYIRLNTIDIHSELPGNEGKDIWSGTYFKGIPITIEAIPKAGYKFSHWENLESTEKQLEIKPEEDLEIKAVFQEK